MIQQHDVFKLESGIVVVVQEIQFKHQSTRCSILYGSEYPYTQGASDICVFMNEFKNAQKLIFSSELCWEPSTNA